MNEVKHILKILFIGCVESSYRLLKKLIDCKADVAGVITKENSSFHSDFCDLAPLCRETDIPYRYVRNVNDADSTAFITAVRADIGFCFGWSQLLKEDTIRLFPRGVVGFHPAALPKNRGRHPLIWALALGLSETASTFFMINAGADEGDIISQKRIDISYEDDAGTLYDRVMDAAVEQEAEIVRGFENGNIKYWRQSVNEGNSWRKRQKADGEIDWRMSGRSIYNLVRSLTRPYVGAHFVCNDKEYKVWKVQEIETGGHDNIEPGKVLAVNDDGTVDIKTGESGIRLIEFDQIILKEGDYVL